MFARKYFPGIPTPRPFVRPRLEALEERTVPSTTSLEPLAPPETLVIAPQPDLPTLADQVQNDPGFVAFAEDFLEQQRPALELAILEFIDGQLEQPTGPVIILLTAEEPAPGATRSPSPCPPSSSTRRSPSPIWDSPPNSVPPWNPWGVPASRLPSGGSRRPPGWTGSKWSSHTKAA